MVGVHSFRHYLIPFLIYMLLRACVAERTVASGTNSSDSSNTARMSVPSKHVKAQQSKSHGGDVGVDKSDSDSYTKTQTQRSAHINDNSFQTPKESYDKQEEKRAGTLEQYENKLGRSFSPFSSLIQDFLASPISPMSSRLGMFSSLLLTPSVDFGQSSDGKFLVVRLQMPKSKEENVQNGAQRKVSAALVASSTLQVHIETTSEERSHVSSSYTLSLPAAVSSEGMTITPAEDGTIQIKLRILNTDSNELDDEGRNEDANNDTPFRIESINDILSALLGGSLPPLAPLTFHVISDAEDGEESKGVVEELPSPAHFERCRHTFASDKLQLRKCLCDVTPSSGRVVCYSRIIATSVSTARRLNHNDFAISTKKSAYECVNGTEDKTQCLERVASQVLKALSHDSSDSETNSLKEQIKSALETDNVTAMNFYPSAGFVAFQIICAAILLSLCFWGGMVYAMRRGWFGNRSGGLLSHLSSTLVQHAVRPHTNNSNLPTKTEASVSKTGNRMTLSKTKSNDKVS